MTFTSVVPYLHYPDVREAVTWLTEKLGFGPATLFPGPDDTVTHADITVGSNSIVLNNEEEMSTSGRDAMFIVMVDQVDAHHRDLVERGVDAQDPYDTSYGPRCFIVTDPWNYQWVFWQGDVTVEPVA